VKELKRLLFLALCIFILTIPAILESANETASKSSQGTTDANEIFIDPLSVRPLYLIQVKGEQPLGRATGFIVQKRDSYYLVTNWHVVNGRNPETNQIEHPTGQTPDALYIWHNGKQLGTWIRKKEDLYDNEGKKRWFEHKNGRAIDVIALPLTNVGNDITIYPLDLSLADVDVVPGVAQSVSVVGFPLGFTSNGDFPMWKTGHIASEPTLDYQGKPLFLIDATTRGGMSGSPVVFRPTGAYKTKKGNMAISSNITLFLGIYSGRIHKDSEVGMVWRPRLINEIIPN
jgi:hypothetical protein